MPRKSKELLRRSRAAKKGWRTRRRNLRKRPYANVLFETGYNSRTPGNGYSFTVAIQRKKKETQEHIQERIIQLIRKGYFDEWADDFDVTDFQWATFHNYYNQIRVKPGRKRSRAELIEFERI